MPAPKWTIQDIPDLTGKTVIVTGANSGTGYESVRGFAKKGAHTIMACRSLERGRVALDSVRHESPQASLELMELNLSNLSSVGRFVEEFKQGHNSLHILANNAGVMALPYCITADGFEMQFGTNHLGHFCLNRIANGHHPKYGTSANCNC